MAGDFEQPPKLPATSIEWEAVIEDFQFGEERRQKWEPFIHSLLDHSFIFLLKKDFPIKTSLLLFLDEFSLSLFKGGERDLLRFLEILYSTLQTPVDGPQSTVYQLKELFIVSATSVSISLSKGNIPSMKQAVESLVETLLAIINRPNHGPDRHARGVACECLRQLEKEFPCLLAGVAGHVWSLCQVEKTHAFQSYLLLFATIICNIVKVKPNVSILNVSSPLVPFVIPKWEASSLNIKEVRRALGFLLECPQALTTCGVAELLGMLIPVNLALELPGSMLKVQFYGMIFSFDPLLCHIVLMLYSHFPDAFEGLEGSILKRLMLISKETHHLLVYRMLYLHWILGFMGNFLLHGNIGKFKDAVDMGLKFYPSVFDPLALKALKLDLIVFWSLFIDSLKSQNGIMSNLSAEQSTVKHFENGLISVCGFKWLPHWSTETAVAFRAFLKFLIGFSSHSNNASVQPRFSNYQHVEEMMIERTLGYEKLVPVTVSFIDRLSGCKAHECLGVKLLHVVNNNLLPRVQVDFKLISYFPLFEKVAANNSISPRALIQLLENFTVFLIEHHGANTSLKSWLYGSRILGICRTMMEHHHTSRLLNGLSRLLSLTCLHFPDVEIRDNARIFLRMLICVPGVKLRAILSLGEQLSLHSTSLFSVQSPIRQSTLNKSKDISSYIHIDRKTPVLVTQCWTLTLPASSFEINEPLQSQSSSEIKDSHDFRSTPKTPMDEALNVRNPLRVMDSKSSEILDTLRNYFFCVPDARTTPEFTIKIRCRLTFDADQYNQIWGNGEVDANTPPAIYASVLTFNSSAPFGKIPSFRIPFLLGKVKEHATLEETGPLDIVLVGQSAESEASSASVLIDLTPMDPTPGFIDVILEASTENGQMIRGQLQSISVGIEDMFIKAPCPPETSHDSSSTYYSDLFDALWEACGSSSNIGRETFPLKGGSAVISINGTGSVKLLEISCDDLIRSVEKHLAPFVVSIIGPELVSIVKERDVIRNATWKDAFYESNVSMDDRSGKPLLTYIDEQENGKSQMNLSTSIVGHFHVLLFLPPRFHLLFLMEVSAVSTLVRIRTDRWPCLAYVDDYLEALVLR